MRVPFSTYIRGTYGYQNQTGASTTPACTGYALRCSESVVGVKRKKPIGWMEPSAYTFTRLSQTAATGYVYVFVNSGNWNIYSGYVGSSPRMDSMMLRDLALGINSRPSVATENSALIKARNNLQSTRVNFGQAIGEADQTARLVGNSCMRLVTAARKLARGDVRGVAKALSKHKKPPRKFVKKVQKTMSAAGINRLRKKMTKLEADRFDRNIKNMKNVTGAWLELQYGWKPLMSDVQGALHSLAARPRYDWIFTAKGSAREVVSLESKTRTSDFFSGRCRVRGFRNVKYILIGIPNETPAVIANNLGLVNAPLLAWELVPFSFVVDWFLPVGSWIDSLDAALGYTEMRTVKSVFCKIDWYDYGDMSAPHSAYVKDSSFSGYQSEVYLKRTVSTGVPLPGRPSIKNPFSYTHMANGLALLVQIFGPKSSSVR